MAQVQRLQVKNEKQELQVEDIERAIMKRRGTSCPPTCVTRSTSCSSKETRERCKLTNDGAESLILFVKNSIGFTDAEGMLHKSQLRAKSFDASGS